MLDLNNDIPRYNKSPQAMKAEFLLKEAYHKGNFKQ